jgi:hypothetical protein
MRRDILTTASLFFTAAFLLSLAGCGLIDAPPVVPAPVVTRPASGPTDYLNRYFQFRPNGNIAGTQVFYRIYANLDTMTRERASIQNANTTDTQDGYNRIVSLGYQEMDTSNHDPYLTSGSGDLIRIRLFDENFTESTSWKAGVYKGKNANTETNALSVPLRRYPYGKGFSFLYNTSDGQNKNPRPASGDSDYNATGGGSGDAWYVNAYAVSVGQDASFTIYHSALADLGFIKISR